MKPSIDMANHDAIPEKAGQDASETLRKALEARFAAMQDETAAKAYQEAFDASPEELGEAALAHASKV